MCAESNTTLNIDHIEMITLDSPKIDLGTITRYGEPPIDVVNNMNPKTFEEFVAEWLFSKNYSNISRVGSTGDRGRDIIASDKNGNTYYYQCKHYNDKFDDAGIEILKLIKHTSEGSIIIPNNYYFVCLHGLNDKWRDAIDKKDLKNVWLDWYHSTKNKIVKKLYCPNFNCLTYNFNFDIIQYISIENVIDEHLSGKYSKYRFGPDCSIERKMPDQNIEKNEEIYINELYKVYSEVANTKIDSKNIRSHDKYNEDLCDERRFFYSAESIREEITEIFTDTKEFDILKEEIFEGIREILLMPHDNNYIRLLSTLKQATSTCTEKSKLSSVYHLIGGADRKGICHILVNEGKIRWYKTK